MGRRYSVDGRPVDIDDPDAVRALDDDRLSDLLAQALRPGPGADGPAPEMASRGAEEGTGFVIIPPPARETP